jgi:hypothetical protein
MFIYPLTFLALFASAAAGIASCLQRLVVLPALRPGGGRPPPRFVAEAANDARYRKGGAEIYVFAAPGCRPGLGRPGAVAGHDTAL